MSLYILPITIASLMSFYVVLSRILSISVIELSVILVDNVMVGLKVCVIIELKSVVVGSCILILSPSMFRSPHRTHFTPSLDNKTSLVSISEIHFELSFLVPGCLYTTAIKTFLTIQLTYLIPDIFNLHVSCSVNLKTISL